MAIVVCLSMCAWLCGNTGSDRKSLTTPDRFHAILETHIEFPTLTSAKPNNSFILRRALHELVGQYRRLNIPGETMSKFEAGSLNV